MRYLGGTRRQTRGRAGRKVAGGEQLADKGQKETKHMQEGFQGKGKEETEAGKPACHSARNAAYVSIRQHTSAYVKRLVCGEENASFPPKKRVQGMWRGGNLSAQPHKKQVQAMRRGKHLQA